MGEFTHFNQHGEAIMVDISKKAETAREAIAEGRISMNQECIDQLKAGSIGKGDVLGVARIAGIMGAKKTSELIPLCHLLSLTKAEIDFDLEEEYRADAHWSRQAAQELLAQAIFQKPAAHCFETLSSITEDAEMSRIGG